MKTNLFPVAMLFFCIALSQAADLVATNQVFTNTTISLSTPITARTNEIYLPSISLRYHEPRPKDDFWNTMRITLGEPLSRTAAKDTYMKVFYKTKGKNPFWFGLGGSSTYSISSTHSTEAGPNGDIMNLLAEIGVGF